MHRCLFKQLTQTPAGLVEKVASAVHNISLSHPFTVPLQWVQGHQMAWWHTEQPDRSTSSFRVAPGARVTAGGVGLKFLLLWIDCLCLRSCYCFVSSMSVVGLQLAHWGCHYHSFWTWLLLKPLTKRPNINNQLRSPVSNTREAWKCVLPSCLGGRALAGRLDGPGQENQGHRRG